MYGGNGDQTLYMHGYSTRMFPSKLFDYILVVDKYC